ncbi:oligopeptide ABC transporter permease [Hathewaya limosa]|uniref:Peptide/nickel transport system permease protein n=1 Tax=Hathewaya limosa TaxID=1536 RepID=A0ABU0JTE9_HATLI|nr:oligopeptide ABC transporter permease [Hathewaya limosa]MDQ0480360.1 peptide/nickel transport system permease protein [Hathewaya limosa]
MLNKINKDKFKKNKLAILGFIIIVMLVLLSVFAPIITKYDPNLPDLYNMNSAPSSTHILGTDEVGRDVFSRLLYGGRVSILVGISAMLVQLVLGVFLGTISGYYGGIVDKIIMRIIDIMMCFPFFVIAITIAAIVGPNIWNLIAIIGLLSWPGIARIVRAEILSLKEVDFIMAAKAMGLNSREIIVRQLIPNSISPIVVAATLSIADDILTEASLSFLGMGVRPPQPSWGNMLSSAQNITTLQSQWWLWIPAGILVILIVISINLVGDGLRDILDPKNKR